MMWRNITGFCVMPTEFGLSDLWKIWNKIPKKISKWNFIWRSQKTNPLDSIFFFAEIVDLIWQGSDVAATNFMLRLADGWMLNTFLESVGFAHLTMWKMKIISWWIVDILKKKGNNFRLKKFKLSRISWE